MTGQAHWLPVAIVFVVLCAVVAMAWMSRRQWQLFRTRALQVDCPGSGEVVDLLAKKNMETGEYVDIERCNSSVLADPDRVTCNKACMHDLRRPRPSPT